MAHFADGVNDQAQFHAQRSLCQHDIPCIKSVAQAFAHLFGGLEPVAALVLGQQVIQRAHQRTNAVDHIQRFGRVQMRNPSVQRDSIVAQLLHIA